MPATGLLQLRLPSQAQTQGQQLLACHLQQRPGAQLHCCQRLRCLQLQPVQPVVMMMLLLLMLLMHRLRCMQTCQAQGQQGPQEER